MQSGPCSRQKRQHMRQYVQEKNICKVKERKGNIQREDQKASAKCTGTTKGRGFVEDARQM